MDWEGERLGGRAARDGHQSPISFKSFPMHEFGNRSQKKNSVMLLETSHPEEVNKGGCYKDTSEG